MRTGMEWDEWYLELCTVVGKKSQCLSRKIGAILVKDKAVVSQGYNGPPRGVRTCDKRWYVDKEMCKLAGLEELQYIHEVELDEKVEGKCPRYIPEMGFKSGEGLEWCVAGHAERNALINAARAGIATNGLIMYMDCGFPCTPCMVEIINAGIKEIVVTKAEFYDISAEYVLKESDLEWRIYSHLCEHKNTHKDPIMRDVECRDCKTIIEPFKHPDY